MAALSNKDVDHIKDLHAIWIAKEVGGNGSEVIDLCTEDIQWLPPDFPPIVGKEEVRRYLANHQAKLLAVETTDPFVRGGDSMAYLTSNYRTRYSSQDHAQIVHEAEGTHLWILRKESNVWRVAVVTWSSWSASLL